MKVYVFVTHAASDGEFFGVNLSVHATKEEAIKDFMEYKKDEMPYVKRDGWVIGTNEEDNFEAYMEGDYAANHTEGFVEEYEI